MMRFAVNVAFLFTEHPYLHRFEAAAAAGFTAVETPWPSHDLDRVTGALRAADTRLVQMNVHAGDLQAGERGYANDPARVDGWRRAVDAALEWGDRHGRPALNLLVGNRLPDVELATQWATLETNLAWAVERVAGTDCRLLVEMLNDRDTPHYLGTDLHTVAGLVSAIGPGLQLQFDTYHVGTMEGELVPALSSVRDVVGPVQLADVPDRHEPGTGDADLLGVLDALAETGYDGHVSLEYVPRVDTASSLAWLPEPLRGTELRSTAGLRLR
jgi:hydroxypyruvate isomerase